MEAKENWEWWKLTKINSRAEVTVILFNVIKSLEIHGTSWNIMERHSCSPTEFCQFAQICKEKGKGRVDSQVEDMSNGEGQNPKLNGCLGCNFAFLRFKIGSSYVNGNKTQQVIKPRKI